MRYTTIVDKDERGLIQIIEAAKKFEEDRFLEGIRQRCYTAADVQTAIDRVREYQSRLTSEARALGSIREVTRVLESVKTLPENELNERKARARSSKDFYRENYHQWDTGQFRMSVALDVLRKGRNDGLTDEETRLWPDDHQHALRVKEVIGRIDTLPGIEGSR